MEATRVFDWLLVRRSRLSSQITAGSVYRCLYTCLSPLFFMAPVCTMSRLNMCLLGFISSLAAPAFCLSLSCVVTPSHWHDTHRQHAVWDPELCRGDGLTQDLLKSGDKVRWYMWCVFSSSRCVTISTHQSWFLFTPHSLYIHIKTAFSMKPVFRRGHGLTTRRGNGPRDIERLNRRAGEQNVIAFSDSVGLYAVLVPQEQDS